MLHPQARALLDLIAARGLPEMHTLAPEEARRVYRERRFVTQPQPPEIAEVRALEAPGPHGRIGLRLYRPFEPFVSTFASTPGRPGERASTLLPVLVYFHGGGWVIGDLDTHDTLCRQLAHRAGCAVIAVDYRLAPEHRFPAAFDDAVAAVAWVARQAPRLGLEASRLAVGGDSAGGTLAAGVALAVRDAARNAWRGAAPLDEPLAIAFQLLVYPATDMRRQMASHASNGQGYLLTRDTIAYFHDHYLGDATHDGDWRASPLLHADHADLPPALVLTAGFDPLRDEGLAYSQRLSEAGNRVAHVCFERQIHGFITMGEVIDEADAAVTVCAGALAQALYG